MLISSGTCKGCNNVINDLALFAKEKGIKIDYFDVKTAVETQESYQLTLELLSDALKENDKGEKGISSPELIKIVDGEIVGFVLGNLSKMLSLIEN